MRRFQFSIVKFLGEKGGCSDGIATQLDNLGNVYNRIGSYDIAMEYYSRGLKLMGEINNKKKGFPAYHNFDNIVLALNYLFVVGAVSIDKNGKIKNAVN